MRSHKFNLPIQPEKPDEEQSESASSPSSTHCHVDDDKEGNKGVLMADPEFSSSAVLHDDGESEKELSKNLTRKRSRRTRKPRYVSSGQQSRNEEESSEKTNKVRLSQLNEPCTEAEPASSVSDATTTEEDVAFCLMMLSRDSCSTTEPEQTNPEQESKKKTNYKCETCGKVFRSYRALGGHRASHKKNRTTKQVSVTGQVLPDEEQETLTPCDSEKVKKISHECPVCSKVFSSGQALGGHKRSHATRASPVEKSKRRGSYIDLNLPALAEDDDSVPAISDDEV